VNKEKEIWDQTADMLGSYSLKFSDHWSYNFRNDPKRLGFVLSRYKFAAKMGCKERTVLELGCGEGIGATILAEQAINYTGIDLDKEAIIAAKENLKSEKFSFVYDDFMGKKLGKFQTVVSLDVVEHIYSEHEALYFQTLVENLADDGMVVIGTPNETSAKYASKASNLGHVNLFTQERLKKTLEKYFHNVFAFGMNDEIVHTGFAAMSHYIFCVGVFKK